MTNTDFGQTPSTQFPNTQTYAPAAPADQPYGYGQPDPGYAPVPTYAPVPAYAPMPTVVDPGRTLGIIGLILSIVASVVGLVVSIVAHTKSKRAGFRNTAAKAGIVVGALTTAGLLTVAVIAGVAAKGLVDQCADLGPGVHEVNGVTYTCG